MFSNNQNSLALKRQNGFFNLFAAGDTLSAAGKRTIITTLVFACLLVYWPVFTHDFQYRWDDQWVVINDYTEGGMNWVNIISIIVEFYHGQYAPVNEFYYLTLYSLFGYAPIWFHAASLIVHITNVLLVFFFIKKILQMSGKVEMASITTISFITALLMAVHPFHVEPVSWMSASKCILFALFFLLSLQAYLRYLQSNKWIHYFLTLILFILSFGAKEQAVTLPVCLLLIDMTLKRNMQSSKVWFEKLPFFCLAIVFIIITLYSQVQNGGGALANKAYYPMYQNIVFASYSVTEYFIKCILPVRLHYLYPFPNLPGEPLPLQLWVYPVLLLFVAAGFWKSWRNTWILFGVGFYLSQISVASNIIPTSRYAIIADRYIYLPSIGIFFLVAYLFDRLLKQQPKYRPVMIAFAIGCFISLGVYANQRCKVWKNSITLKSELRKTIRGRKDFNDWLKKNNAKDETGITDEPLIQ